MHKVTFKNWQLKFIEGGRECTPVKGVICCKTKVQL